MKEFPNKIRDAKHYVPGKIQDMKNFGNITRALGYKEAFEEKEKLHESGLNAPCKPHCPRQVDACCGSGPNAV